MTLPRLEPDWPAPANVRAFATTRVGGLSRVPFDSFNLATHVGDDAACVVENRRRLGKALGPALPVWLDQVHGIEVLSVRSVANAPPVADASWTDQPDIACCVLTADCLPVLLCDRGGSVVAAAHCGWRSLSSGLLARLLDALPVPSTELLAWLGPGISAANYEVGDEVREAFAVGWAPEDREDGFTRNASGRFQCDLALLARRYLVSQGVVVAGGDFCTFAEQRFYSYRRDGPCGRMASLIWRERSRPPA